MQSSSTDLAAAALVSDQIRQIHRRTFLMRLHATNAMVVTRSRGIRVPGFETVSQQMGQLSQELNECLAALRATTTRWVGVVSQGLARERERRMLEKTAEISAACARRVAPVLAVVRDEEAVDHGAERELTLLLDDARRLAATGCVLARTAKLEAVYGGDLAGTLFQAAAEFTELADSVDESVRAIARRLGDSNRRDS